MNNRWKWIAIGFLIGLIVLIVGTLWLLSVLIVNCDCGDSTYELAVTSISATNAWVDTASPRLKQPKHHVE
jgi:hypothetical protein